MLRRTDPLQLYADIGGKRLVDAIKACEKTTDQYDRRYLSKRRSSANWHEVGRVRQIVRDERSVRLDCENGWIELYWSAPDCLRVRLRTLDASFEPPISAAVENPDLAPVTFELTDSETMLELRTSALVCRVSKRPFKLWLELPDRRLVCSDAGGIQWGDLGDVRVTLALTQDEACYGLGMRAARLNLRGKRFRLWNADPGVYKRDADPLYYSVPFYLGLKSGLAYGVFWDNPSRGMVDLTTDLTFEAESGELRYYVLAAGDASSVLSRYGELVGRIELPPLWALGYGHGQFRYGAPQDLPRLAADFRNHSIPCDTLYLDPTQTDWDVAQLRQVIAELHALGYKVLAPLTPGIDPATDIPHDLLLRYPDGEPVTGATWEGARFFPDFSANLVRERWRDRIAPLVECGIDGFALTLAEPTIFRAAGKPDTLPDYAEQHDGTHEMLHNLYAAQMIYATSAALAALRPDKRPVIVTQSGYAGSSELVSTGATAATWENLRLTIPMILNMSLSGLPLSGVNVGGYQGDIDGELYTRWLQAVSLLPFLRAENFAGTPPRVAWGYGQPYELINRLALQLRYQLLPYLYSRIALSREYGVPVVRPLFMLEPENPALRDLDDSYLIGDILVAPVLEKGAIGRAIYLPPGLWYDYWTNEAIVGGRTIKVMAALERLPLYIRGGTVLPMLPEMQQINGRAAETLMLHVYPGDAETVLYEDSGDGPDLENGNYRWLYFTCEWDEDVRFIINRRAAGRFEPSYKLIRVEVVGLQEEPIDVRLDRQGAPLWFFDNGVLELTADDTFRRIEITRRSVPTDRTVPHRTWYILR